MNGTKQRLAALSTPHLIHNPAGEAPRSGVRHSAGSLDSAVRRSGGSLRSRGLRPPPPSRSGVLRPPPSLPSPFMRCPVCGGTTSMGDHYEHGVRIICSLCYSCDTRWDLRGNCIHYGQIVRLPLVHNLKLAEAEDDAAPDPAFNYGRHAGGRPPGSKNKHPRKRIPKNVIARSEATKQSHRNKE